MIYGFSLVIYLLGFPAFLHWASMVSMCFSMFSMVSNCSSLFFPMVFPWFSYHFPPFSPRFPLPKALIKGFDLVGVRSGAQLGAGLRLRRLSAVRSSWGKSQVDYGLYVIYLYINDMYTYIYIYIYNMYVYVYIYI